MTPYLLQKQLQQRFELRRRRQRVKLLGILQAWALLNRVFAEGDWLGIGDGTPLALSKMMTK